MNKFVKNKKSNIIMKTNNWFSHWFINKLRNMFPVFDILNFDYDLAAAALFKISNSSKKINVWGDLSQFTFYF